MITHRRNNGMSALGKLGGVLLVLGVAFATAYAQEKETRVLSVGQVRKAPSLPDEAILKRLLPELSVVAAPMARSEVLPSTTPLPDTLAELPEVVSVLVGFHDSDLPGLCEKGLLEPLDGFFEELGLNPREALPPNVLQAITREGKIWALPYRVETYVLRYKPSVLARVGATPSFATWEGVLAAADKVSHHACADRQVCGFTAAVMPEDFWGAFIADAGMQAPAGGPTFSEMLARSQERKVIRPDDFDWKDPEQEAGIKYELFRTVVVTPDTGVAPIPRAMVSGAEPTMRPLGFMECFAVRKNSSEKVAAARTFLKALVSQEAQLGLVKATSLKMPLSGGLGFRHIPVFRQIVDSPEFARIAEEQPAYRLLVDEVRQAALTPPTPEVYRPLLAAVLARVTEVRDIATTTGDRMKANLRLADPLESQPSTQARAQAPAASSRY